MKEQFRQYLIESGYKEITPSGHPSTVYDYIKRIEKVCEWERKNGETLAMNIDTIVAIYDVGGAKEEWGKKSHSAVINALRRYQEFVRECHHNL